MTQQHQLMQHVKQLGLELFQFSAADAIENQWPEVMR